MSTFYNRTPDDIITNDEHPAGLQTTIVKYAASFSISVYKGRYKVAYVYRSPYQRKHQNYTLLKSEKLKRSLSELEADANQILESEEQKLMHEYKPKFTDILSQFPKPSYPIATL